MFAVHTRDAAMSVAHVFAKTNIGDRDEVWTFLLNCAQSFLDDAVFRVGAARLFGFLFRNSKKQDRLKSGILRFLRFIDHFLDRDLKNTGHAHDRPPFVDLFADEKRENEIVRGQIGFADEIPQRR
jgi:hypothetical protein